MIRSARRRGLAAQLTTWRFLVFAIVIVAASRLVLGTNDWAGLGQWVGGLGALYAAGVALYIATGETRRERAREDERLRTHAYYIRAEFATKTMLAERTRIQITNTGSDPVRDVRPVALHPRDHPSRPLLAIQPDNGPCVVLPGEPAVVPWGPKTAVDIPEGAAPHYFAGLIEIEYRDLSNNVWRRIGNQPPTRQSDR